MSKSMKGLFIFSTAARDDAEVKAWFNARPAELGTIAARWFDVMRACGEDVRELLHDRHPTACVGQAAFCYVNAFSSHVNVGFFRDAELDDPAGMLVGNGKIMRHVKLAPGEGIDEAALTRLIENAYADMLSRVEPRA